MAEINKIQLDNNTYDIQDSQGRESIQELERKFPIQRSDIDDDIGFIDKTVDNLDYYYNRDYIDGKVDELKQQISGIPKFKRKVVETLPENEIDPDTLYLLRTTEPATGNLFEEWIWIVDEKDPSLGSWEYLGAQKLTVESVLESVYPVGSIYMSMSSTDPNITFGFGTWEQIQGRFLLAAGKTNESDTKRYTAGETGGAAAVKLTSNQLPKMGGSFQMHGIGGTNPSSAIEKIVAVTGYPNQILYPIGSEETGIVSGRRDGGQYLNESSSLKGVTVKFGNDEGHDNMPPYLTVYMWQRTA